MDLRSDSGPIFLRRRPLFIVIFRSASAAESGPVNRLVFKPLESQQNACAKWKGSENRNAHAVRFDSKALS